MIPLPKAALAALLALVAPLTPLLAQQGTPPRGIVVEPEPNPPRAIPVMPSQPDVPVPSAPPQPPAATLEPSPTDPPRAIPVEPSVSPTPQPGEVIKLAPGNELSAAPDEVLFRTASNLYKEKLYHLAAPQFEAYLTRFPYGKDREAASFRLAECYRELGQDDRARSLYRQIITAFQRGPFVGSAAYRLAESMVRTNDLEAARSYFELASSQLDDPKLKQAALFRQARCLEMLGRPESARASYRRLLESKGETPYREATLQALAQIAEKTGRKQEAFDYYSSLAEDGEKPALRAESAIKAGFLAADLGKLDVAAELYRKALAIPVDGPWHGMARVGLLRMDYEAGNFAKVIETYESGADDFADSLRPEALLLVANSHRQLGKFSQAADLYAKIMEDFPGSTFATDAAYQQLVALYSANDPRLEPAVRSFLKNRSDDETTAQARLLLAESLYKQQRFAEAAEEFLTLSKSPLPGKFLPNVYHKLAWCMAKNERLPEAIAAYTTFLEKFPNSDLIPTILAERGLAYQQAGELNKALADFDRLAKDFPKAPQTEVALQQKGLIQGQIEDNEGMVATFERLLRDFPKSSAAAQANYWIGWAKFESKDYAASIAPLERSMKLDPETYASRAALRLLLAHYYLEDVSAAKAAAEAMETIANAPPAPAEVLLWLGEKLSAQRDFPGAIKFLEMLVSREAPVAPPARAWLLLAQAHRESHAWEKAITAARTYIQKVEAPADKAAGHLVLARTQLEAGNSQAAREEVATALRLQPEGLRNADARMLEAEIDFAEMRFAEAAKAFQRVAVLYDDVSVAPVALEKAYLALKKAGSGAEAAQIFNELRTRFPEYRLSESP